MTPRHDLRLVPAGIVAWASAAAVVSGWGHAAWVCCAAGALATTVVWMRWPAWAPVLLVPVVVGAAVLAIGGARVGAEHGLEALTRDGNATISGTLEKDPRPYTADQFSGDPQVLLTLAVSEGGPPGGTQSTLHGEVLLIAAESWAGELAVGDTITVTAAWEPADSGRPVAIGWDAALVDAASGSGAMRVIADARQAFRDATQQLDDETRGLVRGMVIGDRTEMPEQLTDDMRAVGLTHLTAVSGTHLSIVAGLLAWGLRALPLRRSARVLGLAVGMCAFAALVLPQPSVIRALAMALVGALGALWGRPAQAMPALATVTVVLMAVDPHLALEPGMVLSVCAVAGIVLLAPALRRRLATVLGAFSASAVSIPLAAQLACTPVLVLLYPSVSAWTVPANIAAVPFAAPVVGLGAMTVMAAGMGLPGVDVLVPLLGLLCVPIARLAHLLASLPGAAVAWPAGAAGVVAAVVVLLAVGLAAGTSPGRLRLTSGVLAVAVILVALRLAAVGGTTQIPDTWRIASCDVGQGDMTVVKAGEHSAVVIDTGPGGGAAECVTALGITQVALLILTHPHADHDGAIAEIAEAASVEAAWWSAASLGDAGARASAALAALEIDPLVPEAGTSAEVGEASVLVLPTDGTAGHPPASADDGSAMNDQSLALLLESGGLSVLVLGDLEAQAQQTLASAAGPFGVDAVKVAHHGSASQDEGLASEIDAAVALVSVGADNTYGHPSATALSLYERGGAVAYRTDECGTIALLQEGGLQVASGCPTPVAG